MTLLNNNSPGTKVWRKSTTDADDQQDVRNAAEKVVAGLFAAAKALGLPMQPLPSQQPLLPVHLDSEAQAALRRLQERARCTGTDLFTLLMAGGVAEWEAMIVSSFRAGVSKNVVESTLQNQLTHEFNLILLFGRTLCSKHPGVSISMKRLVQYRAADGTVEEVQVDLMFPATERTVVRLMQAWWDLKGGKPNQHQQAAAAREAPKHKAMPTRFFTDVLVLVFWQSQLMEALKQLDAQMLANKAKGVSNWFHPASLTSGAQYANNSAALRARQAAYGLLAAAWHLYTGGRPAECFRMRWDDTGVPGAGDVPVWGLGLAGLMKDFQETPGSGFWMINYHAKALSGAATS